MAFAATTSSRAASRYAMHSLPENAFSTGEDFSELFESSLGEGEKLEGSVIRGIVSAIIGDIAVIDVGLKAEGRIPVREFGADAASLKAGDSVEVFLERVDNRHGEVALSREKALREEAWERLEASYAKNERVEGVIFSRVKGGFTVDLHGAVAFLPGSQVDIRPVRDVGPLMHMPQPFQILKMDRRRGNIVVSRRAILEESRTEARKEMLARIQESMVLEGVVKNITDYGAFIDLGGIDGLLHVTDISWRRVGHPSEVLTIGQSVEVMVIKFDRATQRISLGMKQLEHNPWLDASARFTTGTEHVGRVTNITDYGAFVELEPGIEGLVHVSEMSWTKKNIHPSKIVATSQEVRVRVLDVDTNKHRISLGMKQCEENPWASFSEKHKIGELVKGEIRNITEFGLFIGLDGEIDGLVHTSDISWTTDGEEALQGYEKGQVIEAKILSIDPEKERVSLGVKQLGEMPGGDGAFDAIKKGEVVTCTVLEVQDDGISVQIAEGITSFIKKADLSRERSEQRPGRFAAGDRIDAKVTSADKKSGKVGLSIKALEVEEQKRAIAEFGSADSGASLGDILGAALNKAQEEKK